LATDIASQRSESLASTLSAVYSAKTAGTWSYAAVFQMFLDLEPLASDALTVLGEHVSRCTAAATAASDDQVLSSTRATK
jgi:hypothetical protein